MKKRGPVFEKSSSVENVYNTQLTGLLRELVRDVGFKGTAKALGLIEGVSDSQDEGEQANAGRSRRKGMANPWRRAALYDTRRALRRRELLRRVFTLGLWSRWWAYSLGRCFRKL